MKIAIDIRTAQGDKAGKGWYTYNMVKNLLEIDHQNQYYLFTNQRDHNFTDYPNATEVVINKPSILWHFAVAKECKKLRINTYFSPTSYITPLLLPSSIKKVVTIHDLVAILFPKGHNRKAVLIEKLLLKFLVKKVDHLCPVSRSTKKDLLQHFPASENKLTVIPCASSNHFTPIDDREKLSNFAQKANLPHHFFLAVGTLIPRKNYSTLLKAFNILQREYRQIHLVIVGKKGWNHQEIFDLVDALQLQDRVHFLSYVRSAELHQLYNLARALVFPSIYEGFGLPPLEAMQAGCPVIASDNSSIPEVVGNAALMIDPQDPQSIFKAMKKIIADKKLATELKEKGLKQAKNFSWKKSARQLEAVFNKI